MKERKRADCESCHFIGEIGFNIDSGQPEIGCKLTYTPQDKIVSCLRGGPFILKPQTRNELKQLNEKLERGFRAQDSGLRVIERVS